MDTPQPTFEELLKELETLVKCLENGQMPLDEAVAAYERSVVLQNLCADKLAQAKAKIELVTQKEMTPDENLLPS